MSLLLSQLGAPPPGPTLMLRTLMGVGLVLPLLILEIL